jgi:DNA-binding PadR family transcriptional regulator
MQRASKLPTPLEICRFYILLALSKGPMHGYAIARQALEDSSDPLYFRAATLSRMLQDLERRGWVEKIVSRYSEGPARTEYRMTLAGRKYLRMEVVHLEDAGRLARQRLG